MHHQHHQHLHARNAIASPRRLGDVIGSFVSAHLPTEPAGPFGNLFDRPTSTRTSSERPTFSRQNGSPIVQTDSPSAPQTTTTKASVVTSAVNTPSSTPVLPTRQDRPDNPSSLPDVQSTSELDIQISIRSTTSSLSTTTTPSSVSSSASITRTTLPTSQSMHSVSSYSSHSHTSSFNTAAPAASSTSLADNESKSAGMSSGGKAGLAIGILLLAAFIIGLGFYFYRRKKREDGGQSQLDDEKTDLHEPSKSLASRLSLFRGGANAPRLSLRPVTQLFSASEKSDASTLVATSAASARGDGSTFHNSQIPANTRDATNPFGDHAEEKVDFTSTSHGSGAASSVALPDVAAHGPLGRTQAVEGQQSYPAIVAGSRRNSPPGPGPNNVHRVQLDFKPSMEDELELRAGALVRLLHEYDDGWALCIRLDRSQQGVVPRTCISKLPVKPRPGPPPGAARGQPPNARSRQPNNNGQRHGAPRQAGPPPNGRYRSQTNTPIQSRPQSPAFVPGSQQGRPRANSDAISAHRVSPQGLASPLQSGAVSPPQAAILARKPVPGQAM